LLGLAPGEQCRFLVSIAAAEGTEQVIPADSCLTLRVPFHPDDADDWIV